MFRTTSRLTLLLFAVPALAGHSVLAETPPVLFQSDFNQSATPMSMLAINPDSEPVASFDLNSSTVFEGAHVLGEPGEVALTPEPPMAYLGDDGRLFYTTDAQGNRIPDYSNAGYMGGGVAIPDAPTRVLLQPRDSGDDTRRIQDALDLVAGLSKDQAGLRGAVDLAAGEYRVSGSLRMDASGVVLRGAGDGPDGTILRATGTTRRTVIEIGGTGSRQEVAGTRRDIVEEYVSVGARSVEVEDASVFEPGDTVIVHRPSTAEWISAIGMDEIPPRPDGGTVTQWQPGTHDQEYDRIVTAVDGNRVAFDAPLVNAIEEEFGGGSVYRYTWPGRINQVGVENIRTISDYDESNPYDEDHAWTFIEFRAAQNGWVRNTTAYHYAFGNTRIRNEAKWITVKDSANLDPVSEIAGSRRYPFYVQGQLNLVKNCYARFARHDFGIDARTRGPNVFLYCDADDSYSDTGPHHRWATGALYDNVHIPDRDIAVQNRLWYGTGHGWAGANDTVWNSSARRIVVQNPPTAQNWAIGVKGTRWEGAHPDYAEDGYWISHGTHVNPQSLYEKQLEDRLDAEGPGGLISLVKAEVAESDVEPGQNARVSLSRRGILDGRVDVDVDIVEGADLLEPESFPDGFSLPAHGHVRAFFLPVREDAYLKEEGEILLRFRHGPGYSIEGEMEFRLTVPARPWDAWLAEYFSEDELADPDRSGAEASLSGDSVSNLIKYALGLDPREAISAGDLPTPSLRDGKLSIEFLRRPDPALEYRVEYSDDLKEWHDGEDAFRFETDSAEDGWQKVRAVEETSNGDGRRFLRLRVSRGD